MLINLSMRPGGGRSEVEVGVGADDRGGGGKGDGGLFVQRELSEASEILTRASSFMRKCEGGRMGSATIF